MHAFIAGAGCEANVLLGVQTARGVHQQTVKDWWGAHSC